MIPRTKFGNKPKQSTVVEVIIMVLSGNKGKMGKGYGLEKGMREVSEMMKII